MTLIEIVMIHPLHPVLYSIIYRIILFHIIEVLIVHGMTRPGDGGDTSVARTLLQKEVYWIPKDEDRSFSVGLRDGDSTQDPLEQHPILLRILGAWCRSRDNRVLSYPDDLQRTGCESMKTTVRTRLP